MSGSDSDADADFLSKRRRMCGETQVAQQREQQQPHDEATIQRGRPSFTIQTPRLRCVAQHHALTAKMREARARKVAQGVKSKARSLISGFVRTIAKALVIARVGVRVRHRQKAGSSLGTLTLAVPGAGRHGGTYLTVAPQTALEIAFPRGPAAHIVERFQVYSKPLSTLR